MESPKPSPEHQWLEQLVGEWTFESVADMGPDQPPAKFAGKETARSLGGLWVVCEMTGDAPGGGTATSLMQLGFDPALKIYRGTFITSMMSFLWIYERGTLDASGKVLTLEAEGPNFSGEGQMTKYKDTIEIKGPDERTLSSQGLFDGVWKHFMTMTYRRVK